MRIIHQSAFIAYNAIMRNSEKIITSSVERLNCILPLTANHRALDVPLQHLHRAMLHAYIDRGRSLTRDEMAQYVDDLDEAVNILKNNDLVVFNADEEPIGAYPFTMEERGHIVSVNGHTVYCMCALDALAVSPMFNIPTKITSRCHITNEPIIIQQHKLKLLSQTGLPNIYLGINWDAASENSCCADSLCTEMIFLANDFVADSWCGEAQEQRQIFQLNDAIDFAARFFLPLINR